MKCIIQGQTYWKLEKDFRIHKNVLTRINLPFGYCFTKFIKPDLRSGTNIYDYKDGEVLKMADALDIKVKIKDLSTKRIYNYFKFIPQKGNRYIVYCETKDGHRIGTVETTYELYKRYKIDYFEAYGVLKFCSLGYSSRKKKWFVFLDGRITEFKDKVPAEAKKQAIKWFLAKYIYSKVIHLA